MIDIDLLISYRPEPYSLSYTMSCQDILNIIARQVPRMGHLSTYSKLMQERRDTQYY